MRPSGMGGPGVDVSVPRIGSPAGSTGEGVADGTRVMVEVGATLIGEVVGLGGSAVADG